MKPQWRTGIHEIVALIPVSEMRAKFERKKRGRGTDIEGEARAEDISDADDEEMTTAMTAPRNTLEAEHALQRGRDVGGGVPPAERNHDQGVGSAEERV
jgi:hypothetical protein